jgi:hypothetical protein
VSRETDAWTEQARENLREDARRGLRPRPLHVEAERLALNARRAQGTYTGPDAWEDWT